MFESFTPGVLRLLERAQTSARRNGQASVEPIDLFSSLAEDEESRAAELLRRNGLTPQEALRILRPVVLFSEIEPSSEPVQLHVDSRLILQDALNRARSLDRSQLASTEHLLVALLEAGSPYVAALKEAGLALEPLVCEVEQAESVCLEPLPFPPEIAPLEIIAPSEAINLGRVLDASANRAREGLRVIEDYARFALDDPMLTKRLKHVRHQVDEAVRGLGADFLIDARDTPGDVGAHIMAPAGSARESPRAVLSANFKRAQEALRSLEEYSKLVDDWISGRFEVARYDLYTIEKLTMTAISSARTLEETRLYFLVGGLPMLGDLIWIVGEALAGGVDAIQLREKDLPDREVLERAREVRILTSKAGARFFLNDRPDLARLAGADGVHLGRDDLRVRDARRIVGPRALIGVSTHDRTQIEKAVIDGAGYLGVGPVFPSGTKQFTDFAGLELVRQAAETTQLPWFAIGGIDESNIAEVLGAGAERVAVSGAILRAESPRRAAQTLRDRLDSIGRRFASESS
jgi:thiamine-phosphate pyrophosphorylase